jgi:hypothetical protein
MNQAEIFQERVNIQNFRGGNSWEKNPTARSNVAHLFLGCFGAQNPRVDIHISGSVHK